MLFSLYCLWDLRLVRNGMLLSLWSAWSLYIKAFIFTVQDISVLVTCNYWSSYRAWSKISAKQKYNPKISYMYLLLCLSQERLPLDSSATLPHTTKEEVPWMQLAYSPQELPLVEYVKVLPAVSLSGLLGCFGRQRALNGNVTIAGWFFSSQQW